MAHENEEHLFRDLDYSTETETFDLNELEDILEDISRAKRSSSKKKKLNVLLKIADIDYSKSSRVIEIMENDSQIILKNQYGIEKGEISDILSEAKLVIKDSKDMLKDDNYNLVKIETKLLKFHYVKTDEDGDVEEKYNMYYPFKYRITGVHASGGWQY